MKIASDLLSLHMNKYSIYFILVCISYSFLFSDPFKQLDIGFLKTKKAIAQKTSPEKLNKNKKLLKFNDLIKELEQVSGLFDFFWGKDKNKLLLSIKPHQLKQTYIANITRQSGDAYYYGGPSMLNEFPFIFKRVGDTIQLVHINVLFRADSTKAISRAVENDFSNSIIAVSQVISMPDDSTGAILVDANKLFIRDIGYVSQHAKGRYIFDYKNSYFIDVKSFIYNTELEISIQYKS